MERKIQLYGRVTKLGKPAISGIAKMDNFFLSYPNKRFIMEIEILEPDTIIHHIWYIIKMVVPAFIQGYTNKGTLLTPKEALEDIIETCPIFWKTEKTRYKVFNWNKFQPECDLSKEELEVAIDWLHEYCISNFNIVIGNYKSI